MTDFSAGQKVFLKAGMMMRELPVGDKINQVIVRRGDEIELTEEEAARWDANLIYAATQDDLGGPEAVVAAAEEAAAAASVSISDMTADEAKAWAADSARTEDELNSALEEEEAGKNRTTVVSAIEDALEPEA